MSRLRYEQRGPRGHGYFPQLEGLGRALNATFVESSATGKADRSAADVQARLDARAAKLARRAKAAR